VRITWYGHACFRLEGSGLTIVTDPYTPERAGIAAVTDPADVVLMSSVLDDAHSNWQMIPGSPRVVNALDAVESPVSLDGSAEVWAVAAMEGRDRPDDPKANALYALALDGVTLCHMGDVGTALAEEQLAPLRGRVDVLLALAGGGETIPLPDLDRAIAEIGPRIVVPMHYATPRIRYELGSLEDFLARHAGEPLERRAESWLELTRETLPKQPTIVVLSPLLG
jgi:L-ascorbate metabolism protein UlaG (beta-lactamase superfamily)